MRRLRSFVLLINRVPKEEHMKVRVLLLVVSIASLLAALVCAAGAIVQRGGGPQATGVVIQGPGPRA
jgi:hypothetical protein